MPKMTRVVQFGLPVLQYGMSILVETERKKNQ